MKVKQLFKRINIPTSKSKTRSKDVDAVKWVCYNTPESYSNYWWQPNMYISTESLDCDFIYDAYNRNMKVDTGDKHITDGLFFVKRIVDGWE